MTNCSCRAKDHGYGAEIVEEINGLLYDGELAAICGVDGFYSQQLTHDRCRIDPRMTFWRVNKYEFTADLVVYLKANAYNDDYSDLQSFTLYVSLDFCIDDRMTYEFGSVSLKQPERDRIKLDDYLIPVLGMREVNAAAEDLLFEYMPEALHDYKLLDPFKLAKKMGLEVAYHKLYKNHKTKSVLYWFDSEVKVTPKDGDDKTPPIVVKIPAGTILINENAVHRDRARLNVYHECFHDEYHWLFYRLQEMHNNDLRKIKRTRKPKNQGKEPKNPLTIMEWEAKQGSMALMMPESIMRPVIEQYKTEEYKIPYGQLFRLMNRDATFLWEGPGGYHERAFEGFVPYDWNADEIELGENDMIPFALDAAAHPEHYQGKVLRLQGQLMDMEGGVKIGRTVMTCCMADLQFMGTLCTGLDRTAYPPGSWARLEARGKFCADGARRFLILRAIAASPIQPPRELLLKG